MLKTIIHTFIFRAATAAISLGLLVASSRLLGAEGRGVLSLALAGIGIIGMLNGFMGGASLVYILSKMRSPRHRRRALWLSAAWAVVSALVSTAVMAMLRVIPKPVYVHVALLGTLANLLAMLSYTLISGQRIVQYNRIAVLQSAITLTVFLSWSLAGRKASVLSYLVALYISYLVCLWMSAAASSKINNEDQVQGGEEGWRATGWHLFRYGLLSQTGLVIQFLNYRLSYFFLDSYVGKSAVGVYSVGSMLAESLWMLPGSMALVLYAKVSSSGESRDAATTSISLAKLSLGASAAMLVILLAIPMDLFGAVFGKDFSMIGGVILCLTPGILALSYSMVINHYLAGIGQFRVNTEAAALGLVVTLAGNLILVPQLGIVGAGLTASAAYLTSAAYSLVKFTGRARLNPSQLMPGPGDIQRLRALIG